MYITQPKLYALSSTSDINKINNMSITISKIINSMHSQQPDCPKYSIQRKLEYFATKKVIQSRQTQDNITDDQLLTTEIKTIQQIMQIYSKLNSNIQKLKYCQSDQIISMSSRYQQAYNPLIYKQYLTKKSYFFHRHYVPQSVFNEQFELSASGFKATPLYQFNCCLQYLKQHLFKIAEAVNDKNQLFRIEIDFLINQIDVLMQQLKVAAFPFDDETEIILLEQTKMFELTEEEKQIYQNQKQSQFETTCANQTILDYSIVRLQHLIKMLKEKQQMKQSITVEGLNLSFDLQQNQTYQIHLEELQSLQINTQIAHFTTNSNYRTFQDIIKYLKEDPFKNYDRSFLSKFTTAKEYFPIDLSRYELTYYKFIHILKNQYIFMLDSPQNFAFLKQMAQNVEKSLMLWNKQRSSLLSFQNYIKLLNICKQINDNYPTQKAESIYPILTTYLKELTSHFESQQLKANTLITNIDDHLTFQLLTNNQMLQNITSYQQQIRKTYCSTLPLLTGQYQLLKINQSILKRDRIDSINIILARIQYTSIINIRTLWKLLPFPNVKKMNFKEILNVCQNNQKLFQKYPHLLQIKNMLVLFQVINTPGKSQMNLLQSQQLNLTNLTKISHYFSRNRSSCKLYELKSKILLFVSLFKMGYFTPIVLQNNSKINLRQRIINLFSKIGSQSNKYDSNLLTSKIVQSKLAKSLYAYQRQSYEDTNFQNLLPLTDIAASPELKKRVESFIAQSFPNSNEDWKGYILNRINVIEHELFIHQKKRIQKEQEYLTKQYLAHLRICLKDLLSKDFGNAFEELIKVEKLFYQQKYEKGWEMLINCQSNNSQFSKMLQTLLESANQQIQLFKFIKVYRSFKKIQSYISPLQAQDQYTKNTVVQQLTKQINRDSLFEIQIESVQALYDYRMQCLKNAKINQIVSTNNQQMQESIILTQAKLKFIDRQFNTESDQIAKPDMNSSLSLNQLDNNSFNFSVDNSYLDYSKILNQTINDQLKIQPKVIIENHRLKNSSITVSKIGKSMVIEVGKQYKQHFGNIENTFRRLKSQSKSGVYLIKSIINNQSKWKSKDFLIIQLQQNNFKQTSQHYKCQYFQLLQQQLILNLLDCLIYLNFTYLQSINISLHTNQLNIDDKQLTFCINPYLLLIQAIIGGQNVHHQHSYILIANMVQLLSDKLTPFFKQTMNYIADLFRTNRHKTFSNFSDFPCFLDGEKQRDLICNFSKQIHNLQKQHHLALKKSLQSEQIKKCKQLMKNKKYKLYAYCFGAGGSLQQKMIELGIASKINNRFTWFTAKNEIVDPSKLPNNESVYTMQYFLNHLCNRLQAGSKQQQTCKLMHLINAEYPKLIILLFDSFIQLSSNYDSMMLNKKQQMANCLFNKNVVGQYKKIIQNGVTPEAKILRKYCDNFKKELQDKLKNLNKRTPCSLCIKLIGHSKNIENSHFINFLHSISKPNGDKTQQNVLIGQHSYRECLLMQQYKDHRINKVMKAQLSIQDGRYLLPLNFMYLLENKFPLLISCLATLKASTN